MYSKQVLLTIFLVALAFISFASDFYATTTDLNVRTGEGINFPVAFTLQKGSEVEVIKEEGEWYRVRYNGETGFAAAKYLKFSRSSPVAPPQSYSFPSVLRFCEPTSHCVGFAGMGGLGDESRK